MRRPIRRHILNLRATLVEWCEQALVRSDARAGGVLTAPLIGLGRVHEPLSEVGLRRLGDLARAAGAVEFFDGHVAALEQSRHTRHRQLAFTLLLAVDRPEHAQRVLATLPTNDRASAALELARGNPDLVASDCNERGVRPTPWCLDALIRTGRAQQVLDVVEHQSSRDSDVSLMMFDASWDMGHEHKVRAIADAWSDLRPPGRIERLVRRFELDGQSALDAQRTVLDRCMESTDPAFLVDATLQLGTAHDAIAIAEDAQLEERGSTTTRAHLAGAYYIARDFRRSRRVLRTLIGSSRHWDAEKLAARMLLEERAALEVCRLRDGRARLRPAFDDVQYLALLQLGDLAAGFDSYLHVGDRRRAQAAFGDRVLLRPDTTQLDGQHVCVIAQDGPGDEITSASLYATVAEHAERVIATCDPRLVSLLQRSFPTIEFVPAQRRSGRPRFGFLADASRSGAFYDLLDHTASRAAGSASAILLTRSIQRLAIGQPPREGYLRTASAARERARQRVPSDAVGIVWRSEFVTPSRSVHFVQVDDLAPLASTGRHFVCLQHDATEHERAALLRHFGDSMTFLDGVDLRNDFEAAAATVSACAAVIGVGTTPTELAAAVGTPTIAIHPTELGTWRIDDDGTDFWHASMVGATNGVVGPPDVAIQRAASQMQRLLGTASRIADSRQ
ncbi:MAG: hypothetical protein AAFY28_04520 [Actinomycetota bacterium]